MSSDKNPLLTVGLEIAPTDEYYRILFSSIEKKIKGNGARTIAVTSSIKGEGKTTTITQMAKIAARDFEKKVLLLEGDALNPQLHSIVLDKPKERQAIGHTVIERLDVMTLSNVLNNKKINGPVFANGLRKIIDTVSGAYDYILVDCPPILPLVDMRIIARVVDGIIMVIRAEGPSRSMVKEALKSVPAEKILGVVLNGITTKWPTYGYGYGYDYKH
ncbi:MAG: CpsD/CapB family tyrosine-protein kinase [Nitrospiria bacterium]